MNGLRVRYSGALTCMTDCMSSQVPGVLEAYRASRVDDVTLGNALGSEGHSNRPVEGAVDLHGACRSHSPRSVTSSAPA